MEILNKRSYTAKHHDNGDGTFTMDAHAGHIHYKDTSGDFQESDITPVDKGTYWEMTKHNYHLRVAKDFGAPLLMQYKNKYDGADHTITYEPHSIAWYNHQTDDVQIFRNQQSVQGVFNPAKNSFYYTNAFGNGIDFKITLRPSGFTKEIVIPNAPAQYPTAPSAGHRMVALFKYGGAGLKVLSGKTHREWNNVEHFESEDGFELPQADGLHRSFIKPAYGRDSSEETKRISLKVMWKKRNNQLWQIKEIPLKAMQNATFPVYFDTDTDYYTGSGDGGTEERDSTWAGAHDATAGYGYSHTRDALDGNQLGYGAGVRSKNNPYFYVCRSNLPIDTSGIDAGATITAATLYAHVHTTRYLDEDNDAYAYVALIENSQASSTAIVAADYDNYGTTKGSDDEFDITSASSYLEVTWDLNATGLGWVKKSGETSTCGTTDGFTCLGLREGHDLEDVAPGNYLQSRCSFSSSEHVTEAYRPYLAVTYSVAATNAVKSINGLSNV